MNTVYLNEPVLLAMRMALEAAELQFSQKLVWDGLMVESCKVATKEEEAAAVHVLMVNARLGYLDHLGHFQPEIIECNVVLRPSFAIWEPKDVSFVVPVGIYKFEYELNGSRQERRNWKIKKVS